MGLEPLVFWIIMPFLSIHFSLNYSGPGDDIDDYISHRQKMGNGLHKAPLISGFPTHKLLHGSEPCDFLVGAILCRESSIDTIVNNLIDSPESGIFQGNLNLSVDVGELYPIEQLFNPALLEYVFSGINFEESAPIEKRYDLARASHRAYSIFTRLSSITSKMDPLSLPFHFFDMLGWKIRIKNGRIYAEFIPSDWY